jgi:hypothetical protein
MVTPLPSRNVSRASSRLIPGCWSTSRLTATICPGMHTHLKVLQLSKRLHRGLKVGIGIAKRAYAHGR